MKKVLLTILDGYGISNFPQGNAIMAAKKPNIDRLLKEYPNSKLSCSGLSVGLPEGQMGNSEVGHLNIGAGRVVYQELTRISKSIDDGDFFQNPAFLHAVENAKQYGTALHLMGLVSDGGVHSAEKHYKALVEFAKRQNFDRVFLHCFMDGRDTLPKSGIDYISDLQQYLNEVGVGKIATVSGRYYAMDRDNRYERIKLAYNAMTLGIGRTAADPLAAVEQSYRENVTDEFIVPTVIKQNGLPIATINDNDSIIFFNFRPDRARQMTKAFTFNVFEEFDREKTVEVKFVSLTMYESNFDNVEVAFCPAVLKNTLGEYLSSQGMHQLRIAETEKYAHVTYFFNGGVETPYPNEERVMISSPKVATYDLKPEMSAFEVTDKLIEKMVETPYDFIVVNFANCDMVGHTGIIEAAVKAVEAVDTCVGKVYNAAKEHGYAMLITADHGNAEYMSDEGDVITSHSTNDVFFIVADEQVSQVENGRLCDIAPTVLNIMNLKQPKEMDGHSLIRK